MDYDDQANVTANPVVLAGLTGHGLKVAFTDTKTLQLWMPLTWLSHMLDVQVYGVKPGGHHLTSLLLHTANAVLLFLVFRRMSAAVWPSAFVAAMFALHPLHVESVAWVSSRKDVLGTFFLMLTFLSYTAYARAPSAARYGFVLACFLMGLMAKSMLVTAPFVLLLLDFWPLGRVDGSIALRKEVLRQYLRPILEKLPLMGISFGVSLVAWYAAKTGGSMAPSERFPLSMRLINVFDSYVAYIVKTVWPRNLAPIYPHVPGAIPVWRAVLAALLLVCVTVAVVRWRRGRPYLAVGWLWYLGTLAPVCGIIQIGLHRMADRYLYVPLTGLSIIIAWGATDLLRRRPYRRVALGLGAAAAICAMAAASMSQVLLWRNSEVLMRHTLAATTDQNTMAHDILAAALLERGEVEEAGYHFLKALEATPDFTAPLKGLAHCLILAERYEDAISLLTSSFQKYPETAIPATINRLALALLMTEQYAATAELLIRYFEQYPDDVVMHQNLAVALAEQGRIEEAVGHSKEALRLDPGSQKARELLRRLEGLERPGG